MRLVFLIACMLTVVGCNLSEPMMSIATVSTVAPSAPTDLTGINVSLLYEEAEKSKLAARNKDYITAFLKSKGLYVNEPNIPLSYVIVIEPKLELEVFDVTYDKPTYGLTGVDQNWYTGKVTSTYGKTGSQLATTTVTQHRVSLIVQIWNAQNPLAEYKAISGIDNKLCGDEFLVAKTFMKAFEKLPYLIERTTKFEKFPLDEAVCTSYSYNDR